MARKIIGDDDDDDDEKGDKNAKPKKPEDSGVVRRKNTVISLLCNSDPLAAEMAISFVHSPDECTYMFEARTPAACGGVEVAQQQLGPSGVFGVIALIAVLVYVVGGCVYQRTVMHQRGWRQLPNYSLWAGIGGFFYVCIPFCLPFKNQSLIDNRTCSSSLPRRARACSRAEEAIVE